MKKSIILPAILLVLFACHHPHGESADYPVYGGNKAGNRYSPLRQINLANVKDLQPAWIYNSADTASSSTGSRHRQEHEIQCQPIVVDGILYGTSPTLKLFAIRAATGEELWKFDPFRFEPPRFNQCRGLTWWSDGKDRRIFYSAGTNLYAIDAFTGMLVPGFGRDGRVSLYTGLDLNHPVNNLYVTATSPGIIYKNTLIIGSAVSESGDAAPGYIRGFDALTGKLIWTFHSIPQPGDPGYDTWPKDAYKWAGGTNNWSGLSLDEKRGVVYFGTGSPSSDFYGGDRAGVNLFSDCIMALDAATGKIKWYYQTIHHDLWDRDIPCPPNLTTITYNGKPTDVVIQATKDGLLYVLDRDSGTSLFHIEERPVPTHGLPGEHPWATQGYPSKPLPFAHQTISDSDLTTISPAAHEYVQKIFDQTIKAQKNKFLPPDTTGTVLVGYSGGAEWGGNAVDSEGILYQNANDAPWLLRMISMKERQKEMASLSEGYGLYITNCSSCHGADGKGNGHEIPSLLNLGSRLKALDIASILKNGQNRMPSFQQLPDQQRAAIVNFLLNGHDGARIAAEHRDTAARTGRQQTATRIARQHPTIPVPPFPYHPPYISKVWEKLTDSDGYPGIKPPWGTLNAIDLRTGDYRWRVPLGEFPELSKKGIPVTGMESYGGPLATAGGLIFIAGTRDGMIRAFDKNTGSVVWQYHLPNAAFAAPITYAVDGIQYVAIAAGGGRGLETGGNYLAFCLPEKDLGGISPPAPAAAAGPGGWILMGFFTVLAIAFRSSPLLKGFSFTAMIFAAVSLAMYYPSWFIYAGDFKLSRLILPLLQLIMFGMGTELSLKEFRSVISMPRGVLIGVTCHYTIMPLISFAVAGVFNFPKEITAGIILVGCCPSGLASNVMSYLARANLALSVSVTAISTLLAPFLTPLLMKLLAGQYIDIHLGAMVWDIMQIVILPIAAGLLFHYIVRGRFAWLDKAMPLVSMIGIALIIVVITAAGRDSLLRVGVLLIAATLLQNVAGYTLGYWSARWLGLAEKDRRTIALEVGMQNAGLASGLSLTMGRLATVGLAPAVFGPMMNISGSALATWWHRKPLSPAVADGLPRAMPAAGEKKSLKNGH
jgi:quinoprotein glucose dehydrogenase